MKVEYKQANPDRGNRSYLIRFSDGPAHNHTPCILVDPGENVDVEELLSGDDYLSAILLTHAHGDHYATIGENLRDRANIYTSPGTASILDVVFKESKQYTDLSNTDEVLEWLNPISEWEQLVPSVRIKPIPVGHVPGAAGFLVQFDTGDGWGTILVTGDFTFNRSAGYPGLEDGAGQIEDFSQQIDTVFLTGTSTADGDPTDVFKSAIERVSAGSRVLLTATGLISVEYAYRLGHLLDELNRSIPVRIVGQAAKLYEQLEYSVPNVTPQPVIEEDDQLDFNKGSIVISGPEIPDVGMAKRFFNKIRDDPNDVLIQSNSGFDEPITDGACTTLDYDYRPHPTQDEIDEFVEAINPIHAVIIHQTGDSANRYKDKYQTFVWATNLKKWYQLYSDGRWNSPYWVSEEAEKMIRSQTSSAGPLVEIKGDIPFPSPERAEEPDLGAEGLDLSEFSSWAQESSTESEQGSELDPVQSGDVAGRTPLSANSKKATTTSVSEGAVANGGDTAVLKVPPEKDETPVQTIGAAPTEDTRLDEGEAEYEGRVLDTKGRLIIEIPGADGLEDLGHGDRVNLQISHPDSFDR